MTALELSRELLFFFSALGAFNGLMLGIYALFFVKPHHISNRFLGLLFVALSLRIGKSVFFHFNPHLAEVYLQIGLSGCFFIGPFLYLYLKSLTSSNKEIKKVWQYHAAGLLPLLTLLLYIYQASPQEYFHWQRFVYSTYAVWGIYIIMAGVLIKPACQKLFTKTASLSTEEIWTLSVYTGNLIVFIAYLSFPYVSYIVGALSFSFVLYLLILVLLLQKKGSVFFKPDTRYADKKIQNTEAQVLLSQLDQLMHQEHLYKDANLTMPMVAGKLNILPHRLSQLINDNVGKSFPSYINELRIKAAKSMLTTHPNYTLEAIGYECGFNSKSTFYSTFKKLTGTTPAQYQNKIKDSTVL